MAQHLFWANLLFSALVKYVLKCDDQVSNLKLFSHMFALKSIAAVKSCLLTN